MKANLVSWALLSLILSGFAACSGNSNSGDEEVAPDLSQQDSILFDMQPQDNRMPDLTGDVAEDVANDVPADLTTPDTQVPDQTQVDALDTTQPPDTAQPQCGDGQCDGGEDCDSCATDCGTCPPVCGDGQCEGQESCVLCPADCGQCPPECGDGDCAGAETCQVCPQDCGACPPQCGDLACNGTETCETCLADCGACPPKCGDGQCQSVESCATCEADCGACAVPCGDGDCLPEDGETCSTCLADCGPCPYCGDGTCDPSETCDSCSIDCYCAPECGDATCNGEETCETCPDDCGACVTCGDNICHSSETCATCEADCGSCGPVCGNLECQEGETCDSCSVDCGACPTQCGDDTCGADETCQNCEEDCGKCPPLLTFTSWWEEVLTGGPIVQGGKLRLLYSMDRLPQCRSTHNGYPGWTITILYTFDLSQPPKEIVAVVHNSYFGTSTAWEQTIDIPEDAENVWFWAHNSDVQGCEAWDSDFGKNYLFPVFSSAVVSQDIGWAGNFQFIYYTEAGPQFRGDVDPAYYFSSFGGSEVATWVQYEVYAAGITDRTYQDNNVMKQVALNAVQSVVRTNAYYPGGTPDAPLKDLAMEVLNPAGNNFVYRWFPPTYVGWGDNVPAGAYDYFFRAATWLGQNVFSLGKTGANEQPRTMVLGQNVDCSLFPFNPPEGLCP